MATEHLLLLGHRRIGFIGDVRHPTARTDLGFTASQQRLCGYQVALQNAGIGYDTGLVRRGPHGAANAEALAAELLALPDPPSAIFAASDTQAMGVLAAADRAGRRVPGELSVIGFDDIESAMLLGLSTVRQPLEDSGAEAARRLCGLLRGGPLGPLRQGGSPGGGADRPAAAGASAGGRAPFEHGAPAWVRPVPGRRLRRERRAPDGGRRDQKNLVSRPGDLGAGWRDDG